MGVSTVLSKHLLLEISALVDFLVFIGSKTSAI